MCFRSWRAERQIFISIVWRIGAVDCGAELHVEVAALSVFQQLSSRRALMQNKGSCQGAKPLPWQQDWRRLNSNMGGKTLECCFVLFFQISTLLFVSPLDVFILRCASVSLYIFARKCLQHYCKIVSICNFCICFCLPECSCPRGLSCIYIHFKNKNKLMI